MAHHRLVLSTMITLGFLAHPAFAADEPKTDTPLSKFEAATVEMMKDLDENKSKQFAAINNSHGVIRSVEDVQQTISRAVDSCSKANPDMKDALTTRFEAWKEGIRPVMKKARAKLDKMVLLQSFAPPTQVRAYLKKFDDAIIYRNQKIQPVPIEKAENCQILLKSMDETQPNMERLITEALGLDKDLKTKETGQ